MLMIGSEFGVQLIELLENSVFAPSIFFGNFGGKDAALGLLLLLAWFSEIILIVIQFVKCLSRVLVTFCSHGVPTNVPYLRCLLDVTQLPLVVPMSATMTSLTSSIAESAAFEYLIYLTEFWVQAFTQHYTLILSATAVFTVIQQLCRFILPRWFPEATKQVAKQFRTHGDALNDLSTRLVAFIHAVYVTIGGIYVLVTADTDLSSNYYGVNPVAEHVFGVAAGYFMWDLVICVYLHWGFAYIMHAVCGLLIFMGGMHPFLQYYGSIFLIFELSTPFLHARKVFLFLDKSKTSVFKFTSAAFGLTFFLARIALGLPASFVFVRDMYLHVLSGECRNVVAVITYVVINVFLMGLNITWFSFIVKTVMKKREPPEATDKKVPL
eukprot:gb/GECG01011896.1/.p1 GENE.gb/GECG01011896.1/~~gb/GECG01011896.1/.p1  ORF type:complete len:381 (+),score=6.72 gb/GECG01011896.1/:1-1143(+)